MTTAAPLRAEHGAPGQAGLDRLTERVRHELELLDYPRREWMRSRTTSAGEHVYDVAIVGAGQGGLATAFGLMRERVGNIVVLDENPIDRAGPWLNFARMLTLRTPKHVTGPDLGVPSLTPRAWYEAQHGDGSWETLGLIPKESWAAYLAYYRKTLGIPVQPDTRVGALRWDAAERAWQVPCTPTTSSVGSAASRGPAGGEDGSTRVIHARRVVLATGIEGSGQWHIPAMIRDALPGHLYAHTRAEIDFAALEGKRVAVLGAGASSFDNASTALEHGAGEVRLFCRRPDLVHVNPYRWAEFVGFLRHFGDLPDADKWRFILQIIRMGQLPPTDTYRRATRHAAFHLHPGASWRAVEASGDAVRLTTEQGAFECDFVVVGTGFVTDLRLRPELALVEGDIARWADRFTPPEGERSEDLLRHPYLGPSFEFVEREPGRAPHLRFLFNYTFGCLLSLGFGGSSISGMKYSIPRLVSGITRSFFVEDRDAYFDSLCSFGEAEF
jgi:FAD-dependent urate hydroxylase